MKLISNIGPRQKQILEDLEEHGESTTQELAEMGDATRNAVSHAVRSLEDRGLVESRPNPREPCQKLRRLAGEENE